jgi:hypothetical protein
VADEKKLDDETIAALKRELAGYEANGNEERAAEVREQLALRGVSEEKETKGKRGGKRDEAETTDAEAPESR